MKILKKVLIGFSALIALLVIAAIVLPIVFKGKIKEMVDQELAKTVNADVVFDVNNFSLSVFRNFPNITVEVKELGVFNRAPFEGVHLFVVDRFDVEINLKDVLFGDQLRVKGITLVRPQINVKVLKDGRANYDITYPSTDTVKKTSDEPSKFSFAIDKWSIENAELVYDDEAMPIYLSIRGLNHSGSGNFNDQQFDLSTKTTADSVSLKYGGAEYLTNKRAAIDAVIGISENYTKYTFKQNFAKLNDFGLGFDGWFKMNEKDFGMDINFKSLENSFKSILSLVPGMYTKEFNKVETKGELSFSGFAKGTYSDKQMPAFNLEMKVKDAMFRYPSLPAAVTNIGVDLLVDNKTGVIENTFINLKNFHVDFGSNPVDAHAIVENLKDYKMDAHVKASLNLAEMSKMFPMEGMEMKGMFSGAITAKGVYDAVKKIPMSGNASLKDFKFTMKSLPYATTISTMEAVFDPLKAELKNTAGTIGKSDFSVNGSVSNYMEYVFGKGTISGTMNFNSTLLDLNEFMTSEPAPADKKDTTKLSVIPVPQNIDFLLHSNLKTVKMMDYTITNAMGDIVVKDGAAKMNNVKFNMLGGAFVINGTYDTKDLQHPKYDFGLKVDDLSIQQAASTFSIIKTYAPIAGMAQGKFGVDFKVDGELGQDMMPKMNTVNGAGLIKIAEAAVTQSKLISGVTSLTSLKDADQVTLKNVLMNAEIKDGKLNVQPFNVKFGNYPASISGSTALDGAINYALKMKVPAGKLGSQFQSLIGSSNPTSEIPVNIGMGGTFLNPKMQLASNEQKQQVKEAVTNVAKDKAKDALQQAVKGTQAQSLVNNLLGGKKDTTKTKDSTKTNPVENVLQNKLQNLLKKKKKN